MFSPKDGDIVETLPERLLRAAEVADKRFELVRDSVEQIPLLGYTPSVGSTVKVLLVWVNDPDTFATQDVW